MFVRELELRQFRNYDHLNLEFGQRNNVFCGPNGQGKTNILESIYLTTCARSHRTGKDKELIKHGEDSYELTLSFTHDNASKGELRFIFEKAKSAFLNEGTAMKQERKIFYNGFLIDRLADLFGLFHAVIFAPEDLMLIKEGPGERRRFIDILISQVSPSYFRQLQIYQKVLKHRNAFLKDLRNKEKKQYDAQAKYFLRVNLDVWDEQLAESAAFIINKRHEIIERLGEHARIAMDGLSSQKEVLKVKYLAPSMVDPSLNQEAIKAQILDRLLSSREEDIFKGYTSVGPHRDDLDFLLNDLSAKHFASQGQQRSIVLSLKIGELSVLEDLCDVKAVLLLDDVMSELDSDRRHNLLKTIDNHQVFITCTDLNQLSDDLLTSHSENRLYYVNDASVSPSSSII